MQHFIEMGFDSVDTAQRPRVRKDLAEPRAVAVREWPSWLKAAMLLQALVE